MSEYKSVTGFGSVMFQLSGRTATFDYLANRGEIEFTFETYEKMTINGKRIIRLKWIDVLVRTYLKNAFPDDYINFLYLYDMINDAYGHNDPVTIYPRKDDTSVYASAFDCFLTGKLKFEDKELFQAGQLLTLDWKIEQTLQTLPFMVNQLQNDFLLNEDGTFILDEAGNKIILER